MDTTLPRVIDHDDRGISFHSEGLLPVEFPLGEPATFLIHIQHRLYHSQLLAWIEDREEWMDIAVGIPQRIDGISVVLRRSGLE